MLNDCVVTVPLLDYPASPEQATWRCASRDKLQKTRRHDFALVAKCCYILQECSSPTRRGSPALLSASFVNALSAELSENLIYSLSDPQP